MVVLMRTPEGLHGIEEYYGVAGRVEGGKFIRDEDWVKENLRVFEPGFALRQSWNLKEINRFPAHKKVGPAMIEALQEIKDFYGLAFMRKHGLDLWGGVYEPRFKRGTSSPSAHSWGIAIDYCPDLGPLGERTRIPWPIAQAFLKRGFEALHRTDGSHFQAAKGY